jgi:hypothetical protein
MFESGSTAPQRSAFANCYSEWHQYSSTVIVTGVSSVNEPEVPIKSMVVVWSGARYEVVQ